ncbi:hypothetical protein [Streptomyces sp. NPDC048639]
MSETEAGSTARTVPARRPASPAPVTPARLRAIQLQPEGDLEGHQA